MANAYSIQNCVTIGKTIQGFYYYGPIEDKTIHSHTAVAMGPPTVFEIINVLESDHHRTSISPLERTQVDYVYRLIVRCGRSKSRMTYARRTGMPVRPGGQAPNLLIPHTSIQEVQRLVPDLKGFYNPGDFVSVTVPFDYPSTETGVRRDVILGKGTLLYISSIAKTQKGGKNNKTDPSKVFYYFALADATENYDLYWKAASHVMHSDIVNVVSLN